MISDDIFIAFIGILISDILFQSAQLYQIRKELLNLKEKIYKIEVLLGEFVNGSKMDTEIKIKER